MGNNNVHRLSFLIEHKHTFDLIRKGEKKIETRAGNPDYFQIRNGDNIEFSCGDEKVIKQIKKVCHFKTANDLFLTYKPSEINPEASVADEIIKQYETFPGYEQRIKEYGILAFELA